MTDGVTTRADATGTQYRDMSKSSTLTIPKSSPPERDEGPLLPVRMLNEYAYCPRLCYLEWVQGEWRDNVYTLDGKRVHARVDKPTAKGLTARSSGSSGSSGSGGSGKPAESPVELIDGQSGVGFDDDSAVPQSVRSVELSDADLGLVAKIDLVEATGDVATPIDYKRGKKPDVPGGAYEPERVQICAQGLLLRRHGYRCESGVLYFAGSRQRVEVSLTESLIERTLALRDRARQAARLAKPPPPLVDSPKCPRCSLVGICLPDEQNALLGRSRDIRPLLSPRDDALPLHVQEYGAVITKRAAELVVKRRDKPNESVRLIDVSRLNIHGSAHITVPALRAVIAQSIPIALFTHGGWYYGKIHGHDHKNVLLRRAQFDAARDPARSLLLAQRFVRAKIRNSRVFLRRNYRGPDPNRLALDELANAAKRVQRVDSIDTLLGVEGNAARVYFRSFAGMLRRDLPFSFDGRNRRPPRDPVNAMLSLAYALLTSEWTSTLSAVGFDPYMGYLHRVRYGRPSLALDMMEEFRPIIADSVVVNAINKGIVGPDDFVQAHTAVALRPAGRRRFIQSFERRMDELITHPIFGYRISYRRVLDVQSRLLGRYLMGEIDTFPEFVTR